MNFWRNNNYKKNNYSKSPNNPFKVAVIIGIDNETINILPPKSTLLAIALSPISLQIETANSVNHWKSIQSAPQLGCGEFFVRRRRRQRRDHVFVEKPADGGLWLQPESVYGMQCRVVIIRGWFRRPPPYRRRRGISRPGKPQLLICGKQDAL